MKRSVAKPAARERKGANNVFGLEGLGFCFVFRVRHLIGESITLLLLVYQVDS